MIWNKMNYNNNPTGYYSISFTPGQGWIVLLAGVKRVYGIDLRQSLRPLPVHARTKQSSALSGSHPLYKQ